MKKLLGLAAGAAVAAFAAPSLAQAQSAYTTEYVNLRAGPGTEYPVVFEVQQGQPLESYGCLDGYSWCDVSVNGYRGWIAGEFITYAYGGGYVPVYDYGPRYGVPIISFSFGSYWDNYYRGRPWYRDRDSWAHYDWRGRHWDNDSWRQWANNNRHDNDRHNGNWNGRGDNNGRDGNWNGRGDNNGRDGNWNGRSDNNGRDGSNGRTGNWNRSDNDRRPGAPVRGTANSGFGSNDPSVHSGSTSNHVDSNRYGNPQRWGNNANHPGTVNYGGQNQRIDKATGNANGNANGRGTDRVNKVEPRKNNQVNTGNQPHVQPRVQPTVQPRVQPKVDANRTSPRNGQNNGQNGKSDRRDKRNDDDRS